jgi:transcriptional regulator with XRE-family HTH domain
MVAPMPRRQQPRDKPIHPLRQWREQHRISQDELAQRLNVTQGMVSHIELYVRSPRMDILRSLCDVTGLSADAFVQPERFLQEHPDFLKPRRRGKGPAGSGSREDQ